MKYGLSINIISNNQSILDGVLAAWPALSDPAVDADTSGPAVQAVDMAGNQMVAGLVILHTAVDRDALGLQLQGIVGVLNQCEVGTYIKEIDTTHRRVGNNVEADGPCLVTTIYEV